MSYRIVLLSGRVASGKSTLADDLVKRFGAHRFKTNAPVRTQLDSTAGRRDLQNAGEALDRSTRGNGWRMPLFVRSRTCRKTHWLWSDGTVDLLFSR